MEGTTEALDADFRRWAEEHLNWAESTLGSSVYNNQRSGRAGEIACALRRRLEDPDLSIGVFGEYSSGKSTLLNAILGKQVLPSSAMVTTSVATVLRSAESEGLHLGLLNGETAPYGTQSFSEEFFRISGSYPPGSPLRALAEIVRSPKNGEYLSDVTVDTAGSVLAENVRIVDTPGFNATDAGHEAITSRVAEEVDLAVVLISASTPGSMTLAGFLATVLADLQDRSVFILTKMRLIPEAERAPLEQWIRSWLDEQGFANAQLLRADSTDVAVAAFDPSAPQPDAPDIDPEDAVAEIAELSRNLASLASDGRHSFIQSSVHTLLNRLLDTVVQTSEERRAELQAAKDAVDAVEIVDFDDFLATWRREAEPKLNSAARKELKASARRSPPSSKLERLRDEAVDEIATNDQVTEVVHDLVEGTEKAIAKWVRKGIDKATDRAHEVLEAEADLLAESFMHSYHDLARLAGRDPKPPVFDQRAPTAAVADSDLDGVFAPLHETAASLESVANWKTWGGAAAGAAVGTAIAPVIGTVIGGFLGAMAGSGREKQQEELREASESVHDDCIEVARLAIRNSSDSVSRALYASAHSLTDRYSHQVGPVVRDLVAAEHRRREQLGVELDTIRATVDEAKDRLLSVRAERAPVQ